MRGLAARVGAALGTEVQRLAPMAGGDLNEAFRAELAGGGRAFVKTSKDAPSGGYAAEAAGLRWLAAAPGGPRVPEVLAVDAGFLVLEWIEPGARGADGRAEEALGRELAALHRAGAEAHGVAPPGTPPAPGAGPGSAPPVRLGPLLLPGAPAATWAEVHASGRLLPLAWMAAGRGALDAAGLAAVEAVAARMEKLAGPPEPPARLHGDLWAGNVLWTAGGGGALVDPAAHGGHREVDLAMLALFGGPARACTPPTRRRTRSPTAMRSGWSCGSSRRSSSTPSCSAEATARGPRWRRAATRDCQAGPMPARLRPRRRALAAAVLAAALAAAGCGREDPVAEGPGAGPGSGPGRAADAAAEPLPFPPQAFEPGSGGLPSGRPEGRTVEVGGRPEGVAVDPESGLAAVGVKGPDQLVLVDVRTGRIARRVPLPSAPRHVQLAAPGGPFLVPAEATDELVEVFPDGRTRATKVGDNPHDATARGNTAWTADEFSSTVSEVRDGRTVRRVPVDVQPGGIVALEDGTVAVVSVRAYTVELLDRDLRPLGSQNVGYGPSHVVADARGRLYIADTRGGGISVFDTQPRLRFAARVELPGSPYGLALDRGRGRLWVTRTARNEVAEIDISGRPRVLRTLPTIQQPNTVGVDPETGTLVIASASGGTVQLLRRDG